MVVRIIVGIALVVLAGGFIFFAGNVIWLGTKEFFRIYGPKRENKQLLNESKADDAKEAVND